MVYKFADCPLLSPSMAKTEENDKVLPFVMAIFLLEEKAIEEGLLL